MNPRERIAGMARLYLSRGEPIPLTLLAEADELGLNLADFDQPKPQLPEEEGETKDGSNSQKTILYDG